MVESTALEMRRTGNRTVGSNPTLSANCICNHLKLFSFFALWASNPRFAPHYGSYFIVGIERAPDTHGYVIDTVVDDRWTPEFVV